MAGFSFSFFSLFYPTSVGRPDERADSIQFNDETRQVQCSNTRHAPALPPATVHSVAATDKQQKGLYSSVLTSMSSFPASGCARTQWAHAFLRCPLLVVFVSLVVVVVMHIDTVARGETAWNSIQTNRVGVPPFISPILQ